jgi:hypothetical protein
VLNEVLPSLDELLEEESVELEDELLSSNCSISEDRLFEDDDADEPPLPDGGAPGGGPGGGPPCAPPGPPWPPPGPLANVLLKRFCNSVAWELVRAPLETWAWIRSLILDLMSPGPTPPLPLVELDEEAEEDWPDLSELSMLVSADDSADSSDELTVPADTSDWSSDWSCWRGLL